MLYYFSGILNDTLPIVLLNRDHQLQCQVMLFRPLYPAEISITKMQRQYIRMVKIMRFVLCQMPSIAPHIIDFDKQWSCHLTSNCYVVYKTQMRPTSDHRKLNLSSAIFVSRGRSDWDRFAVEPVPWNIWRSIKCQTFAANCSWHGSVPAWIMQIARYRNASVRRGILKCFNETLWTYDWTQ